MFWISWGLRMWQFIHFSWNFIKSNTKKCEIALKSLYQTIRFNFYMLLFIKDYIKKQKKSVKLPQNFHAKTYVNMRCVSLKSHSTSSVSSFSESYSHRGLDPSRLPLSPPSHYSDAGVHLHFAILQVNHFNFNSCLMRFFFLRM